jgi:hypothetical protein
VKECAQIPENWILFIISENRFIVKINRKGNSIQKKVDSSDAFAYFAKPKRDPSKSNTTNILDFDKFSERTAVAGANESAAPANNVKCVCRGGDMFDGGNDDSTTAPGSSGHLCRRL